jgi:GAF domain-containing protein
MDKEALPQAIKDAFNRDTREAVFTALLSALGDTLQVDRCFLHLRNPHKRIHRNICWRRSLDIPDTSTDGWKDEEEWEKEDPMFAAALRGEDSIFVEDVETASPSVLNREFEQKYLGHRSLVHAHLCQDKQLWGILQPSLFNRPRVWSDRDRISIACVVKKLTPIVVSYINERAVNRV